MGLINCPECGKEISDMAQSCPNCGRPLQRNLQATQNIQQGMPPMNQQSMQQQRPKKKGHGCLITFLIFAGIIVVFAGIGVASGINGSKDNNDIIQGNETETGIEDAETGNTDVKKGEVGEIADGLLLVVNEVTETESVSAANGMMSYKPKSGKYAVVNVTISNQSKKSQSLMLSYFKLVGPDEAEYVATIAAAADDKFITVDTVNPNLDITGNLLFEIPKDLAIEDCILTYKDYDIFNQKSYFELK